MLLIVDRYLNLCYDRPMCQSYSSITLCKKTTHLHSSGKRLSPFTNRDFAAIREVVLLITEIKNYSGKHQNTLVTAYKHVFQVLLD